MSSQQIALMQPRKSLIRGSGAYLMVIEMNARGFSQKANFDRIDKSPDLNAGLTDIDIERLLYRTD